MIKVGIVYEVAEVTCEICRTYFVSVIETPCIEWSDKDKEVGYLQEIECANCGKMTTIKR